MKNDLDIKLSKELKVCQVGGHNDCNLPLKLLSLPGDLNYLIQAYQILKPGWVWPNFLKDSKPSWVYLQVLNQ